MQNKSGQIKSIRRKQNLYELKVILQCISQSSTDLQQYKLQVNLKVNSSTGSSYYRITLIDQTAPIELITAFTSIQIAYDCFIDSTGYQVNIQNGQILIKGVFQFKGRKLEKKYLLKLQKYQVSQYEQMIFQIQQLHHVVAELTQNKILRQNQLKKQYQDKLDEEKKKFQQIINCKEQQLKNLYRKQTDLEKYVQRLNNKLNEVNKKIENFTYTNLKQLIEIKNKAQKSHKQMQNTKQQLQQLIIYKNGKQGSKRVKLSTKQQTNSVTSKQNRKSQDNKKKQQINSNNQAVLLKYIDERSRYLKKFEIKQHFITYIGQNQQKTELLMKKIIPREQFHFQFKIIKSKQGSISIGVIDQNEVIQNKFTNKRSISYQGKSGYVNGAGKYDGDGFKQGDTVHVIIDLRKPLIQWKINGKTKAKFQPIFLQNQSRVLVPFIEMYHQGDCVDWIDLS